MDEENKIIMEYEISAAVGKVVSQWIKKNEVDEPVLVQANVMKPTCYIDETGASHTGNVITVNCHIIESDDDDDDDL